MENTLAKSLKKQLSIKEVVLVKLVGKGKNVNLISFLLGKDITSGNETNDL